MKKEAVEQFNKYNKIPATPILRGKDAENFLLEMHRMENLDPNSDEAKKHNTFLDECVKVYRRTLMNSENDMNIFKVDDIVFIPARIVQLKDTSIKLELRNELVNLQLKDIKKTVKDFGVPQFVLDEVIAEKDLIIKKQDQEINKLKEALTKKA